MSDCSSLENLLAEIDAIIDRTPTNGDMNELYQKQQVEFFKREIARMDQEIDAELKRRVRDNGGYTRGVRG